MPLPASLEAPAVHTRPGFECTALLQCGEDPRVPDRSIPLPYCVLDGERWIDPSHFAAAFGYSEVPLRTARHQPRLTAPLQPSRAFAVLQADYPRHFKWIRLENPGITRHCVTLRIILLFCATGPHIPEKHDGAKQRFKNNNNGKTPKSTQSHQAIIETLDYRYKLRHQVLSALACALEETHTFQPKHNTVVWRAVKVSKAKRTQPKEKATPRLCLYVNNQPLQVEVRYAEDMELKHFTNTDKRADRVHYNESDFHHEGLKVTEHRSNT
jgi:hypothetical protein